MYKKLKVKYPQGPSNEQDWVIPGINPQIRNFYEQAAQQVNKPVGQYLSEDIYQQLLETKQAHDLSFIKPEAIQQDVDDLQQFIVNQVAKRKRISFLGEKRINIPRITTKQRLRVIARQILRFAGLARKLGQ